MHDIAVGPLASYPCSIIDLSAYSVSSKSSATFPLESGQSI
jgi:hypothetical protein